MSTVPEDYAAEQATLGALLIAGRSSSVVPDILDTLRGADYYRPQHEQVHEAVRAVHDRDEPVDPVTVAAELDRRGMLQRIGGAPYLHTLSSEVPTAASGMHYAKRVLDLALRRRLVDAAQQAQRAALEATDAASAVEDARQLLDAAATQQRTSDAPSVGETLVESIDWLEAPPVGADTPWQDVNRVTNGLLAGQMITVAARPGHGKSLVAKDVALFTAQTGRAAHVATLEMSRKEYTVRILCGLARVDLGKALRRQLSDGEWTRLGEAASKVNELPLVLDDREKQTMGQIRASARQTMRRYGELGLIAIDYAQLVTPRDVRLPREQQVAEISRDVKLLAKEFGCPVMLLAQLSRKNVDRPDKTPMVSDLRESGALEQDSDQVWLLHRPDQYAEERFGEVDLIVGKNRNGQAPTTIPLAFQGHYARVVALALD